MPRKDKRRSPLPPLIFGEADAQHTLDARVMADRTAQAIPGLNYYEAVDSKAAFHSKTSTVSFNGLVLTASASTPITVDVGRNKDFHLFIPFAGQNVSTMGKEVLSWNAGETAVLLPEVARGGTNVTTRSVLLARVDRARLASTAQAMAGGETRPNLDIQRPRELSLRHGAMDFAALFRRLCNFIDLLDGSPAALSKMGIEDLFYRQVVAMLCPRLLAADIDRRQSRAKGAASKLNIVCDSIRSRPDRPLTMTEMERLSGMSERALQYAFAREFGCTPMEWQRRERLLLAHERIIETGGEIRLTDLALDAGFSSLSAFSSRYTAEFGEPPSVTRARSRRRR